MQAMAPEDDELIEGDGDTVIVVEADEPEVVEDAGDDVTVIVDSSDEPESDAVDAVVVEQTIDNAVTLATLAAKVSEVEQIAYRALAAAEDALANNEVLADTDEAIIAATDEAIVETVDNAEVVDGEHGEPDQIETDEIAPVSAKVHPLFRTRADWMNR
jgi:hypothetical protein